MKTPRDQPVRPFGHFRLTAFFVVVTVGAGLLGAAYVGGGDVGDPRERAVRAVWIAAIAAGGVGFAGVFFHRMRVNPVRWRETEKYVVAIRRESAKYRLLMEGAADLLLVVDPRTRLVTEAGRRAREELGLRPGVSVSALAIVHPDERGRFEEALARAAQAHDVAAATEADSSSPGDDERAGRGEKPERREEIRGGSSAIVSLAELRFTTTSGASRLADARLAAVDVEGERLVQVSLRDVTTEKEMERSLRVHERLSSIGLLTAGVAHEINNPLEGIGNYLKLLEKPDLEPATRARYLSLVRHGFDRIGEIVRDLLRFARPAAGRGRADLSEVVAAARKLTEYSGKLRDVAVETRGLEAPLVVEGEAGRLEQVVVNLLLNAGTAMNGRGRIAISARRTSEGEIELSIEDEGPGIPPGDLARIFDPFFTRTDGAGLGLSICYGIVAAHGGRLWAENRAEGGARFTIRLPRERRDADSAHESADSRRDAGLDPRREERT